MRIEDVALLWKEIKNLLRPIKPYQNTSEISFDFQTIYQ